MNNINFIQPVPPRREREIRWWLWATILSCSAVFLLISIYTGIQWHLYRSLSQERNVLQQKLPLFNSTLEQQRIQTKELEELQKKINQLTRYTQSPKSPIHSLNAIRTITGNGLQSVAISKKSFELQVSCRNAQHATICLQKLMQDSSIRIVKLTSLQSNQKQIIALFKGEIAQ